MAFVKRNVGVQRHVSSRQDAPSDAAAATVTPARQAGLPGTRPSPLTGRTTTSTGVASLDAYLGGHAGLVTGSHLLVEEPGTTDFAGSLLKYFAAEGLIHGHHLHVVGGPGEQWVQQLPGRSTSAASAEARRETTPSTDDKMKIAWRYQQLGLHNGGVDNARAQTGRTTVTDSQHPDQVFCHNFDLAKRLVVPQKAAIHHLKPGHDHSASPYTDVITRITNTIASTSHAVMHRVVIPGLLSPAFYPPHASDPQYVLRFLHSLRSLLRQHSDRLTVMASLPVELYSRDSGLVRWMEHLCDGVIELQPFAHLMDSTNSLAESGGSRGADEQPQGMLRLHKLPELSERGVGGIMSTSIGDDLAFTLSRRRFAIRPFSLPPLEGDQEAQAQKAETGAIQGTKKADIEF